MLFINIQKARQDDFKAIADFIAKLNADEKQHVGYCGTNNDEIYHYINEEFEDLKAEDCFHIVQDGENITAVLGYEPDLERRLAELWGPFVKGVNWKETAQELYSTLVKELPKEINKVSLFSSMENQNHMDFAENNHFTDRKVHYILYCEKGDWQHKMYAKLHEIDPSQYDAFTAVHDRLFPGTYFSGQKILERLDDDNRVFVISDNDAFAGYVYVESEKEFNEGTNHFIGVEETKRGKGFGRQLLINGVSWLFDTDEIDELELCVSAENTGAIRLYESVGFKTRHRLYAYTKTLH